MLLVLSGEGEEATPQILQSLKNTKIYWFFVHMTLVFVVDINFSDFCTQFHGCLMQVMI